MASRPPRPFLGSIPPFNPRSIFSLTDSDLSLAPMRPVPFAEMVRTVWLWLIGRQPKTSARERFLEERVIERLREELAEEDSLQQSGKAR